MRDMKKRRIALLGWALVLAVALIGLTLGCEMNVPSSSGDTVKNGQAGTTLTASKTATGFWEKVITYDWTIEKKKPNSAVMENPSFTP
jgi:hypothetical protein